ncbi:hypothetical protein BJX99DRAFT_256073 [Aspergillus californicus]
MPTSQPTTSSTRGAASTRVFVLDGTTYTIGPYPTIIVDGGGDTVTIGPDGIVIGTEAIWASGSGGASLTTVVTDGVTITVVPSPTTSSGPLPGPTTISSTVITWTATQGSSTMEITFTPTTFTEITSLTTSSTVTSEIDGYVTTAVVGTGGIAWDPVTTATPIPGFLLFPFPTAALDPEPQSTSTMPTATSSSTSPPSTTAAPTVFPFAPVVTTTSTSEGPDGLTILTVTGTTDSAGAVVPIMTLLLKDAIGSAQALISELSSASEAIFTFSSSTADAAKATSAADSVEKAHSGTNDLGSGISISSPNLWGLFGSSLSGIGSILNDLASIIS